jgi:hypothetical protein
MVRNLFLCLAFTFLSVQANAQSSVGINSNYISDVAPAYYFNDLMHSAIDWSRDVYKGWLSDPNNLGSPSIDSNGYPIGLKSGQSLLIPLGLSLGIDSTDPNQPQGAPAGTYTLITQGTGTVTLVATLTNGTVFVYNANSPSTSTFTLDAPPSTGIQLKINTSLATDYVHGIRVLMPGVDPASPYIWNQSYISTIASNFKCYRFMTMQGVAAPIGSFTPTNWGDNATLSYYTWPSSTGHGIPFEIVGELCTRAVCDGWVCAAHTTTPAFWAQMATTLKGVFPANQKLYVEFSNETWNTAAAPYAAMLAAGRSSGFYASTVSDLEVAIRYSARQSLALHNVFKSVFPSSQIVPILATQTNAYFVNIVLNEYVTVCGGSPPVIAVSPYVGWYRGNPAIYQQTISAGVNGLFTSLDDATQPDSIPANVTALQAIQTAVAPYKTSVVSYEMGFSWVGSGAAQSNTVLTSMFLTASRDARSGIYATKMLTAFAPYLVLQNWFNDIGSPGQYGDWGLLEHQNDPPSFAPKYAAVMAYASPNPPIPPTPPPLGQSTATFVGIDAATQGNWPLKYGLTSALLIGSPTPVGSSAYTWVASTTDVRAPLTSPSTPARVASTWYSTSSFTYTNKQSSSPYLFSVYCLDWDGNGTRNQTVQIADAVSGSVLDTRTITGFQNGVYLTWNVTGNVTTKITNINPSSNAVVSAFLYGGPDVPTYSLVRSGQTGQPLATFTLTTSSAFFQPILFTFADGGYGSFSVPSPSLSAGQLSEVITWTPNQAGSTSISVTNSIGMTNPAAIPLSIVSSLTVK